MVMEHRLSIEQLGEMMKQLTHETIENWLVYGLGTWRWWILLVLLIVPWFGWYKVVDKKRLDELIMFGLVVMVFTITLDELGFVLSLWGYPVDVIPIFPRLTSVDYTVVPIIYMLTYQCFFNWSNFFWALVAVSAVFSFVVEPIIAKLGFYVLIKWTNWASFLIYIPMGLFSRWIARIVIDVQHKANAKE